MEPTNEKLIVIARHTTSRALLLQSHLEAEGIDCFLSHENLVQGAFGSGVELRVRRSDMEKALKLIEMSKEEHGSGKEPAIKTLRQVRKILVPVDFSDASLKACTFALGLAAKLKAEIKLLHVYYNPVIDVVPFDTSHAYQVNLVNYLHEAEQNAKQQLIRLADDLKQRVSKGKADTKISYSLQNGIAAEEIVAMANHYRPGLIVLGTRGIGQQTSSLLGSVTARVIEKTSVPVLAIHEASRFTGIESFKNVLYATDFDESDHIALSRLINLLHPFHVQIYCVHISIGIKKPWQKVKMDSLKSLIDAEHPNAAIHYDILVSDDILNGLETFMRNQSIDVISLTNHNRGLMARLFTPSITKKILKRIDKPLFVFKSGD
ncbi:MAG: universal stress protein [Lentimicrobiaceae bacterium]|jgi:nucleotide-binding universal stress UspA family protein|nr:universal stress protein [Lentimicrobiaceae bacterium]MDY0026092.1 universal stress protein [Lentimicrobium sp.]HAH57222.1 universal stress protein UspA [Bacteroidales bacterium]